MISPRYFGEFASRTVARSLARAGATYIKLGQWMSTRPDIFPPHLIAYTSTLLASVPIKPSRRGLERVRQELGVASLSEVFSEITPEPEHAGSVGEVYYARLRPEFIPPPLPMPPWYVRVFSFFRRAKLPSRETAPDVIVKVLHPGVEAQVATDVTILQTLAAAFERVVPGAQWLGPKSAADEFAAFLQQQLDLRVEAANLATFRRDFAHYPGLEFPRPIAVTRGVLVESRFAGRMVADFARTASPEDRRAVARRGLHVFLRMMFLYNFIHADLHGGNILVADPPPLPADATLRQRVAAWWWNAFTPHVCIIDAGLVSALSDRDFDNFVSLFTTIAINDGAEGARCMLRNARRAECTDVEGFERDMVRLYNRLLGPSGEVLIDSFDIGGTVREVLDNVRRHRVLIETNFASTIVAIMLVEGLGRALDPSIDIVPASVPYLLHRAPAQVAHLLPVLYKRLPGAVSRLDSPFHRAMFECYDLFA